MQPDGDGGGFLATLVRACAAAVPLFVVLYYTDEEFRETVDAGVRQLQAAHYQVRLRRWYARVWEPLEGWQREVWEQRHGPPPRVG
jgi:hypothetical protein